MISNASNLIDIYKDFYPVLNNLSTQKGYIFLRLIPLIHEIRDDFPKVSACLTMLLDATVQISTSYKRKPITTYSPPELGFATLGYDTLLGSFIEDGEPDIDLLVTLTNLSEISDSLFFDRTTLLAQQLCNYFIGAQYEISVSYAFDASNTGLVMGGRSLLGYNVYL
ncbi:hypothetical protein [Cytophaga aurantiaca]|uniref:hypothetical protein n=1 Tax=Cytophaga aurantiaca TaxID=29530 RepID=UPI00039B59C3|nr:hypothetical protein [Cytophaga aurantiaca]